MPRFILVEMLGQGATGVVYKATDATTETTVAVKMPAQEVAESDFAKFQAAYELEARVLKGLNQEGLLRFIEQGIDDGRPFIAYEYLQGHSLRSLIAAGKKFTATQVATLLAPLLDSIDYLHSQGIVHRDINPNNLLLMVDGRGLKLIDFGAATRMQKEVAGPLVGTPQYMAPEQLQGGAPDPRSDLFSVGVVVYELLTGQPPFLGNSFGEVTQAISAGHFTPASQLVPDLPESTDELLRTALAVDPNRRYQSSLAMRSVLIRALSGAEEAPQPVTLDDDGTDDLAARPTMVSGTPVVMDSPTLIAMEGPYQGQQFPVSGGITTLGGPYADIDLSRDLDIAAQHCWIVYEADQFALFDAEESGGTQLNTRYVKRAPLLSGDLIQIGQSVFKFRDPTQPVGASRPAGSVEYAPEPSRLHHSDSGQLPATPAGGRVAPANNGKMLGAVALVLLVFALLGLGLAALTQPGTIKQGMTFSLDPVWARLNSPLQAKTAEEFIRKARDYEPEMHQEILVKSQPNYPGWLVWLPPVGAAVESTYRMRDMTVLVNDVMLKVAGQESDDALEPETLKALSDALLELEKLQFPNPPWLLHHTRAMATFRHFTVDYRQPIDDSVANHPILVNLPKFDDGLKAYAKGDFDRAFTLIEEVLVTIDGWYRSASDEELKRTLTKDLHNAGDAARAIMAIAELRESQIRLLHKPIGDLTENDLDTIEGWIDDAEKLLRQIDEGKLKAVLVGLATVFGDTYDPETLFLEIDKVDGHINDLRKLLRQRALGTPGTDSTP